MNNKRSGFVINDYKMTGSALSMDRVYHGLSLQLLASLLVVQANGPALAGQKITPAAAFVLQLLRSPQLVDHPSQAMTPADPDFPLRPMPRGIIDARAVPYLDKDLKSGPSKVINVFLRQDGERGKMNATDAAGKEEFNAILQHVEKKLGELGDQITTGNIAVMPYMIARKTPCSHCEFRSVCRFEPGINRYRMLQAMKREEVMIAVTTNSK
jgi:ATP-dependent helicase/nuclease subunit B